MSVRLFDGRPSKVLAKGFRGTPYDLKNINKLPQLDASKVPMGSVGIVGFTIAPTTHRESGEITGFSTFLQFFVFLAKASI